MTTDEYILQHVDDDVRRLALMATPEGVDIHYALCQIEGRQLARRKLPSWAQLDGIIWPTRLALEQCSSLTTAQYKRAIAQRLLNMDIQNVHAPRRMVDLTGGLGVDFFTMAGLFDDAVYVERQPALVDAARHNAAILAPGGRMQFVLCQAEDYLERMQWADVICLDPARRDLAGRKVTLIEDCQPDVAQLHQLLLAKCRFVIVKLSPMLDLTAALRALPATHEVHVVGVDGECKEVVLVLAMSDRACSLDPSRTFNYGQSPCLITCAMLGRHTRTFSFRQDEEASAVVEYASDVAQYLYEPDACLLKAGVFRLTGERYGVKKLARDTHLYTSDQLVADFPGRVWHVVGRSSFGKRELRSFLSDIRCAELATRGFPVGVATLRRQLKLSEGSDAHLIATTLADGRRMLLRVVALQ